MSLRARVTGTVGQLRIDAELDTAGGTLVVVGPNGSGKSSLLAFILGVRRPERGRVELGPTLLFDAESALDVPVEERRLGYVPQDYALFPHLSVRKNLAFGGASAERVERLLRQLELEPIAERRPGTLSGGERQRVALARALSTEPRALLLDEPLSAFDVHSRREMRAFLEQTLAGLGLPTVLVTHDAADARQLGHRIAVLEAGRITQAGSWDELREQPGSRFVEELVGLG